MRTFNATLTEDEMLVLETYRRLAADMFGDMVVSVHRGRLAKRNRNVKEDVPMRTREIN